jgi:hypothetical protein
MGLLTQWEWHEAALNMKKRHSNPVSPSVQAEINALAALPEDKINTGDSPEAKSWDNAKRGMFHSIHPEAYGQE